MHVDTFSSTGLAHKKPKILPFLFCFMAIALLNKLNSLSLLHHTHESKTLIPSPISSLQCKSSYLSSPFTEKHSSERYRRDRWVYNTQLEHQLPPLSCSLPSDADSVRENDIALQLPELKRLLQLLKDKRERDCVGGDGDGNCGVGNVFLVGTGPGDPELLTLKAVRVIKSADLLLYDRLVSNDVLDLVNPDARLLYVGKTAGYHSRTQVKPFSASGSNFVVLDNFSRLNGLGDAL